MCASLDLPEPQGSIRNRDASVTPRTPPIKGASGCSTEVATRTQAPFGKSVLHDLKRHIKTYKPHCRRL